MSTDRRDFLALGVGALAVAVLPRTLRRKPGLVRRQVPVMGTVAEVAVLHRDGTWAQRGIDAAFAELRRVDETMTRFRADSDVGRASAGAGGARVSVSVATADVLAASLAWARASNGRFDPCLGRATALWDAERRHEPPPPEAVRRLAHRALWRSLEIDRDGTVPAVRLHDPDAALDLGGVAKGFAVDLAARALRDRGIFRALVNVGGDLVALGTDGDDEPWRIGVRSPEHPDRVVHVLEVSDAAVATSGDYLRFFEYGGRRYHHLLDPTTGAPRETRMHSLTMRAERCVHADAAATAIYGAGDAETTAILTRAPAPARVVHSVIGVG